MSADFSSTGAFFVVLLSAKMSRCKAARKRSISSAAISLCFASCARVFSAAGETCLWPGRPFTHWGIEDPVAVEGTE
jgi:hypothetical protein